mmetsp:Transcript_7167/g.16808  ORF Transcript_7167/g.16808 Transcript_7167/m.16808 type:complete len:111 (-) Transcript_7167:1225-1557(-)
MTITSAGKHHLLMVSAASTILIILLQLGFTAALQQRPVYALSYRNHLSLHRPIRCPWSPTAVAVDETDLPAVQETRTSTPSYCWDQQFEELLLFKANTDIVTFHKMPPHT